jgi:hypothetical protein
MTIINESLLWALVIYYGDRSFQQILNEIFIIFSNYKHVAGAKIRGFVARVVERHPSGKYTQIYNNNKVYS